MLNSIEQLARDAAAALGPRWDSIAILAILAAPASFSLTAAFLARPLGHRLSRDHTSASNRRPHPADPLRATLFSIARILTPIALIAAICLGILYFNAMLDSGTRRWGGKNGMGSWLILSCAGVLWIGASWLWSARDDMASWLERKRA
ncbi:MAG: hypothetical protein KF838_07985 [Phycisphaeraceae bacterium]|nr:MAG: hypothetical protein KF838_07985 [Phycisphaeraceae bacterium]